MGNRKRSLPTENFPLTPALSPWERETLALPRQGETILCKSERQLVQLPLPSGEGWGEGDVLRSLPDSRMVPA